MRVLQVINSLGTGGAEKLLLDTIPLYRQRGIQMDLLVFWDDNCPFLANLKDLRCCKVHVLKKSTNYKDIYRLGAIPEIRKLLKDYDIAHVHLFPAQYFVALANLGLNKKILFTEHSTTNKRIRNRWLAPLDRLFYRFYTKVIAISDDVQVVLGRHISGQKNKILKIENGVDITKIVSAESYHKGDLHPSFQENDIVVCQVSAFRKGKDQKTLVRAMAILPKAYKLILVGGGDEEEMSAVKKMICDLDLEDRVFLLGNRIDVSSVIKSTDINILSSEFEGLSLASIEGLASGKPFVASDVSGLRDIVDGAGVLFPLGDAQRLAEVIQELIDKPDYAQIVAARGMERAKQYDIATMVQKHIEFYQEVSAKL